MKKLSLLLALVLAFGFVACGGDDEVVAIFYAYNGTDLQQVATFDDSMGFEMMQYTGSNKNTLGSVQYGWRGTYSDNNNGTVTVSVTEWKTGSAEWGTETTLTGTLKTGYKYVYTGVTSILDATSLKGHWGAAGLDGSNNPIGSGVSFSSVKNAD